MKSNPLGRSLMTLLFLALVACGSGKVWAQEGEPVVVDEVIAQVDNEVVMLSSLKREMKEATEAISKQKGVPVEKAAAEVENRRAEIIATLINEQLLLQKGKELDLANEVEAEVNKRMLAVANEQNIKSIAELDQALIASGMVPEQIRQTLRVEIMKNAVLSREVDARIYFGLSNEELQKYFKEHPDKFIKQEAVKLSEIFLSLAGKNPAEVEARARQLVAQARGGSNFGELAAANSERVDQNQQRVAVQTKGVVGTFEAPYLREDIAAAIKNVKAGGTSDPIKSDEGFQIIHVDERTAGGSGPEFNENRVREAILGERAPKEREAYLQKLREDSYIKVADQYASSVMPLLKVNAPTTAAVTGTTTATPAKNEKKSKN